MIKEFVLCGFPGKSGGFGPFKMHTCTHGPFYRMQGEPGSGKITLVILSCKENRVTVKQRSPRTR